MATWNKNNVVITTKGLEVLSKVQSGVGKIIVSRIVVGSGRATGDLIAQTSVTGENTQAECTLTSVDTDSKGSILNISMSNKNVTTAFELNQIGVYVTHSDYLGEVLYLLAQVDSGTADTIPVASETLATSYFSIYMKHEGVDASSVVIDVTESGVALKSISITDTISTTWSNTEIPYEQAHSFSGMTKDTVIEISLPETATEEQVKQFEELNLQGGSQGVGTYTLRSFGDLNTVEIPIIVIKRGDF